MPILLNMDEQYQQFRSIMDGISTSLQRWARQEQEVLNDTEAKVAKAKADIEKANAVKLDNIRKQIALLQQQKKVSHACYVLLDEPCADTP